VLGAYGGRGVYLSNANLEKLISDHSGFFTLVSPGNPLAIYTSPFRMLHATLQSSAEPIRQHGMIVNSPESLKTPTADKKNVFFSETGSESMDEMHVRSLKTALQKHETHNA